jgi:hypothetical protein
MSRAECVWIIIAVIFVVLGSYAQYRYYDANPSMVDYTGYGANAVIVNGTVISIVTIDGCEYINSCYSETLTHKANCSNPVHKEAR